MVLLAAAVLAILAAAGAMLTSRVVQADREAELLFRGLAYRQAIRSYFEAGGRGMYPRRLEDLLADPRFAKKCHIRRLYEDPMQEGPWVLVQGPGGGIAGVASRSTAQPLKQSGFPLELAGCAGATRYADWLFLFTPRAVAGRIAGSNHAL